MGSSQAQGRARCGAVQWLEQRVPRRADLGTDAATELGGDAAVSAWTTSQGSWEEEMGGASTHTTLRLLGTAHEALLSSVACQSNP